MNNRYLTRTTSVIAIEFQATWGHDISLILRFVGECIEPCSLPISIDIEQDLQKIIISYAGKNTVLELKQWLVFDGNNFEVYSSKEFDEKFEKAA